MSLNPVISMLGRKLRLALVGGGPGSFIGAMHRQAARLDDRYEVVSAVLSSDPGRCLSAGRELGLEEDRIYYEVTEMCEAEAAREDGAEVAAIMTPNDSHFPFAKAALENGLDVICDKPMTNTIAEAETLVQLVRDTGLVFCLTHNYTGYPMVRQARAMVANGQLGDIRLVQVEYVQGGKAREDDPDPADGPVPWRFDPARSGPSLVLGDIGSHAHNLVRFIAGLEVTEVAAEVGAVVPNRRVHDFAGALLRLEKGGRGSFWVTQASAGVENCLRIRVSGTKGSLEWMQEHPQVLQFKPLGAPAETRTPNGPGTLPLAARSSRIVAGHPEGFPDGFANIYSDAAEVIAARRTGSAPDPLAMHFPTAEDGLLGVRFIERVLASSQKNGTWTAC
ncbi:MAG: Gfo/Idh/MocA family oxidoreductase [Desulfofustis sp.]|nr:Gfo/Idh/MocA family oxidoreductase [Desulfofustis sp.]